MHSPRLKEATQVLFNGCCPNPIFRGSPSETLVSKTSSTTAACRRDFAATTASSLFTNTTFTNHESIPSLQESFLNFIETYPKYSDAAPIDRIRARDYAHLELSNHVSLDYIGVGLFSQSQIPSPSSQPPEFPLFGLSFKPVSLKSELLHGGEGSELENLIKKRVMEFLKISEKEYAMVFTVNRSAAFKLVAECYPFHSGCKLATVYDHESEALASMISASEKRGAEIVEAEFKWPRLSVQSAKLKKIITTKLKKRKHSGLLVFPLQSRMSGASYSYQWMTLAREHGWRVLLDACALGPKEMDAFGLSLFRPDFLISSFYKVFGENPTGFGCLFVKKCVIPILEASAGAGIVSITPPMDEQKPNANSDIKCRCLDQIDSLGLSLISRRSRYLINWLITALTKLRHPSRLDDFALVTIYGPKVKFNRAPALAFNISDWKGEIVEPALVQKLADRCHISLGHGTLRGVWRRDGGEMGKGDGRISAVTAVLSFLANFEDVYRLWAFVAQFLDADFVEKERWRYTALNQRTVEV